VTSVTSFVFLFWSVVRQTSHLVQTSRIFQTSNFSLLAFQNPPQPPPLIVKIVEPKQTSLADVVIGALGLSGVLLLVAIVFAVVVAGILLLIRSRDPLSNATEGTHEP